MPATGPEYKDRIPADGHVILQWGYQHIVTERYTIGPGALLQIDDTAKLVVLP